LQPNYDNLDSMNIIILNCGSSSIKSQLSVMPGHEVRARVLIEKVGLPGSLVHYHRHDGLELSFQQAVPDHHSGIRVLLDLLTDSEHGCIKGLDAINAVGHRVVHAGEKYSGSVPVTADVIKALEECIDLAPLHNPPNLEGIRAVMDLMPGIPQVGVFDTAFHQTMPPHAFLYGLPYSYYKTWGIRRYGFHGTSHRYVASRAAMILHRDMESLKMITCHLGNGSSMAAIVNGKSIDTTMGMTPLEGLIMGTRCGDLDVGVLLHIAGKESMNNSDLHDLVNKRSGMLGVSGISPDMRDIEKAAAAGDDRARIALEMFAYRVKKYIGAYAAAMGGVDVIVFTGGIGENDVHSRQRIMGGMGFLGIDFDSKKNATVRGKEASLTRPGSKVQVMVIPTDEERIIAEDTFRLVSK